MVWRLIVVVWLLALSVWGVLHFAPQLSAALHTVWGWDKDQIDKLKTLLDLALPILTGVGAVVKFILAKPKESPKATGNSATFNGPVKINGDFVQRDKNLYKQGDKDA